MFSEMLTPPLNMSEQLTARLQEALDTQSPSNKNPYLNH